MNERGERKGRESGTRKRRTRLDGRRDRVLADQLAEDACRVLHCRRNTETSAWMRRRPQYGASRGSGLTEFPAGITNVLLYSDAEVEAVLLAADGEESVRSAGAHRVEVTDCGVRVFGLRRSRMTAR